MPQTVYDFKVKNILGEEISLSDFKNKILLIVNTASQCGFTPQYDGLEKIYAKYRDKGFEILAFPCNQFGSQEPGSDQEIKQFCELNYKVSFPLFSKIEVNGKNEIPLYRFLKNSRPGVLGTEAIKWNFTKFLIDRTGNPVKRFAPSTKPEELEKDVENLL